MRYKCPLEVRLQPSEWISKVRIMHSTLQLMSVSECPILWSVLLSAIGLKTKPASSTSCLQ
eukprot:4724767-Amphidinium_carterae.1